MTDSERKVPVISLYRQEQLIVYSRDVRRVRYQNNISLQRAADSMNDKGWSYYASKLWRLEKNPTITLDAAEMLDLIASIGAGFEILKENQ